MSELVLEKNESIPSNWIHTTIGEISSKIHYGYTTKSTKEKRGLKYLRITDIQNNSVKWEDVPSCQTLPKNPSEFLLRSNDLIFARTGATVGKSFLMKNPPESIFASYLIRIILSEKIYANYVSYFFKSSLYWNQIRSGSAGMAQPNFNATKLSKIKNPLPPLNEQKRIVVKIEELFSLLESTIIELEKSKILLAHYRHSLFHNLFEGNLNSKEIKFDIKKWKNVCYDDVSNRITYGFTNPMPDSNEGAWKITAVNIRNGKVNYENARKTDWKSFKSLLTDKSRPKVGTVVIIKDGATIGRVGIIDRENTCISQTVASLEPNNEIISEFLAYSLQRPQIKQYIEKYKRATAIPHISITDLAKWKFLLPPINDQEKIIIFLKSNLSKIDNMKNLIENSLFLLKKFKIKILKQAFEGKLVPQDPNDEPAEVLLQKIKQEKEQLIQNQKTSRSTKNVK